MIWMPFLHSFLNPCLKLITCNKQYTECKYGRSLSHSPPTQTSCMKARLVSPWCFVFTMLLQKSLASSPIWFTLFCCSYELLCPWMPWEGVEIFHHSPHKLRENRGSCLRPRPLAWNCTKRILWCNNQADELQLPLYCSGWQNWAKWQWLGAKGGRLRIL